MTILAGKRILLGVTGGIAAYKAVELLRLLKKAGAQVDVAMTEAALRFVGRPRLRCCRKSGDHGSVGGFPRIRGPY